MEGFPTKGCLLKNIFAISHNPIYSSVHQISHLYLVASLKAIRFNFVPTRTYGKEQIWLSSLSSVCFFFCAGGGAWSIDLLVNCITSIKQKQSILPLKFFQFTTWPIYPHIYVTTYNNVKACGIEIRARPVALLDSLVYIAPKYYYLISACFFPLAIQLKLQRSQAWRIRLALLIV